MCKISQFIPLTEPLSCAVLDACPFGFTDATKPDGVLITRINVPRLHRGKGYGRTMLKAACDVADLTGTTLYIEAWSYDNCPMTQAEISDWYQRNGFVEFGGILRRVPK
jgi:GNAT superfamily N-acetyltransferase